MEYQEISNNVCKNFKMKPIPILLTVKLRKHILGLYYGNIIKLRNLKYSKEEVIDTLLHELAHHLDFTRYENKIKGYYKIEMWNKMEVSNIDNNGMKWYSATGKPEAKYIHTGKSHGKNFKFCLQEIRDYYKIDLLQSIKSD